MENKLTRRDLLKNASAMAIPSMLPLATLKGNKGKIRNAKVESQVLPVHSGPFEPSWESLSNFETPEWFRDAKLGIWAHWTAQCVPEQGDWYARSMYVEYNQGNNEYEGNGSGPKKQLNHDYKHHLQNYGHPSVKGFKDIDHIWHAEKWNPGHLIDLYKKAGAKYFVALANHHDNFDCFNSQYQDWNAVNLGPKRDIVGTWEREARNAGLHFGVTVHAARTWDWYEVTQGSDVDGPLQGVPYDGLLTKADGKGLWWEGYDPQDLYAQNHAVGAVPNQAYCEKFFNRVLDLINKYNPDLLYFDDYVLPLYGVDPQYGLKIAAHLYNSSAAKHGGKNQSVLTGKNLNEAQRKAITWDLERGLTNDIEPFQWQTDTCIGDWHYLRSLYENKQYKTSESVIHTLIDIVSKNGNLLLNIPVRGNGEIDSEEVKFLAELGDWMSINSEGIYGTRPWHIYGEGPDAERSKKGSSGNFNEGSQQYSSRDIRYTKKGNTLFAFFLGWPDDGTLNFPALGIGSHYQPGVIKNVTLMGGSKVFFNQTSESLKVSLAPNSPCKSAFCLKLTF